MKYRDWQRLLAPPWLREGAGGRFLEGLGEAKDGLVEHTRQAVLARMIQRAPEAALGLIGDERLLPKFPNESVEAYRARLLAAWEFWRRAGTLPGLVYWLLVMGYDAHVYEHFRDDPSIWAEFSIYLWPHRPEFTTDRWDDEEGEWDDDTPWDYALNAVELQRVPALVREVKPAHAKVRSIYYIPGPRDAWDDGGVWDEDSDVWGPEPIQIYP